MTVRWAWSCFWGAAVCSACTARRRVRRGRFERRPGARTALRLLVVDKDGFFFTAAAAFGGRGEPWGSSMFFTSVWAPEGLMAPMCFRRVVDTVLCAHENARVGV